jgi:SAM-dependent methyltransferase
LTEHAAELGRHRRDWEELAEFNAEWAVLSTEETKFAGWDPAEFFATGRTQINALMVVSDELGMPRSRGSVLDFGCGLGRLATPLSERFDRYVGVDISAGMIERAARFNAEAEGCVFVHNEGSDLTRFEDRSFDTVVTFQVLQHVPGTELIHGYIRELGRVLASGGLLALEIPTRIPVIYRLRLRRRLYRVARALGISADRAHRMGLQSMWYQAVPPETVISLLESSGCQVVRRDPARVARGVASETFYATRAD